MRSRCHYLKVIEVREDRLFADSRNPRHDTSLQPGIGLKRRIKQASGKGYHVIPVSSHISLLHRRIIFIQEDNDLFPIIAVQVIGQLVQRQSGIAVADFHCQDTIEKSPVRIRQNTAVF